MIDVLYFAWVREHIGHAAERMDLPSGVDRVHQLIELLVARGGGYAEAFARRESIRCAVNQSFAGADTPLATGDEVAFFPPVTGG